MLVQKIQLSNNKELRIFQDEDAQSPREWDNMSQIFCFHKRYCLGDDHNYSSSDFQGWDEFKSQLEKDYDIAIILPVYMYDHSGITISTSSEYPFNDRWDAGQVGWVFITKGTIRKEYGSNRITKKKLQRALTVLLGEIKVYDQYLRGEVYGFELVEKVTCEHCQHTHEVDIDSCWGFFGYNIQENGILEHFNEELRKEVEAKL